MPPAHLDEVVEAPAQQPGPAAVVRQGGDGPLVVAGGEGGLDAGRGGPLPEDVIPGLPRRARRSGDWNELGNGTVTSVQHFDTCEIHRTALWSVNAHPCFTAEFSGLVVWPAGGGGSNTSRNLARSSK